MTVSNAPPSKMLSSVCEHVADVPLERVPVRDRLGERVLVPERDSDDDVQREQEEDRQPGDPGKREERQVHASSSGH